MVHLLLINVVIPANAQFFFSNLLGIVSFNLVDISGQLRQAFGLYDEELINSNFADLGYVSNCFVVNMGNLFIVMLLIALLHVIKYFTRNVKHPLVVKVLTFFLGDLVWSTTIQFFIESLLVVSISCFTNISTLSWRTRGMGVNSVFALAAFAAVVGMPIFSFVWLRRNQKNLEQSEVK